MIALDTNVLVRYLTQDDVAQSAKAGALIEDELTPQNPGFVSSVVLAEIIWVLQGPYAVPRGEMIRIVGFLLGARTLVVEHAAAAARALRRSGGDLADGLIHEIGKSAGCAKTVTFDRKFAKAEGVALV